MLVLQVSVIICRHQWMLLSVLYQELVIAACEALAVSELPGYLGM